jgi:hypothetical protein
VPEPKDSPITFSEIAHCAAHVDQPSAITCARCGGFACEACIAPYTRRPRALCRPCYETLDPIGKGRRITRAIATFYAVMYAVGILIAMMRGLVFPAFWFYFVFIATVLWSLFWGRSWARQIGSLGLLLTALRSISSYMELDEPMYAIASCFTFATFAVLTFSPSVRDYFWDSSRRESEAERARA